MSDEAEFLERYPPEVYVPRILAKYQRQRPSFTSRARAASWAAAGMAALLLFALLPRAPETRTKGGEGAALRVYRAKVDGVEQLASGARAGAGDRIQLSYRIPEAAYGVLFSVDGKGHVTRHLPEAGVDSVRLIAGREVLLERAFELDDSPGFEKFYLATDPAPFAVDELLQKISRKERVPQNVSEFSLTK